MEEKRKSYKPEIKDERVEKLVNLENLEPGEVFIRSDDLYMVIGDANLVAAIDLANGHWVRMDGRDLVCPVKVTITIK